MRRIIEKLLENDALVVLRFEPDRRVVCNSCSADARQARDIRHQPGCVVTMARNIMAEPDRHFPDSPRP